MLVRAKPKISDVLMNERVAINFTLKLLMCNWQVPRNDLPKSKSEPKKNKSTTSLCRIRDKVKRIDQEFAKSIGLKNKDALHQSRSVSENGLPALVDALNYKKIALSKAAEFAALAPDAQHQSIVQHLAAKGGHMRVL